MLLAATSKLGVINEVSTPEEARARVRRMAEQKIGHVKMWVDDRGGTYPKLQPDTYQAIIDEAHKHKMLVHAHAIQLADQKAVVRAGANVLVSGSAIFKGGAGAYRANIAAIRDAAARARGEAA